MGSDAMVIVRRSVKHRCRLMQLVTLMANELNKNGGKKNKYNFMKLKQTNERSQRNGMEWNGTQSSEKKENKK